MEEVKRTSVAIAVLYGFTISLCIAILLPAYYFLAVVEDMFSLSFPVFCIGLSSIIISLFFGCCFICRERSFAYGISYFTTSICYLVLSAIIVRFSVFDDGAITFLRSGVTCVSCIDFLLLIVYVVYETKKYLERKTARPENGAV